MALSVPYVVVIFALVSFCLSAFSAQTGRVNTYSLGVALLVLAWLLGGR